MNPLPRLFAVASLGTMVVGTLTYFIHETTLSGIDTQYRRTTQDLCESIRSGFTMGKRWEGFSTTFGELEDVFDPRTFERITSSISETYNKRSYLIKSFDRGNDTFYDYVSEHYNTTDLELVTNDSVEDGDKTWPIVYISPFVPELIGIDVSIYPEILDSIKNMASTGLFDIVVFPDIPSLKTDILYGFPVNTPEGELVAFTGVTMDIVEMLDKETWLEAFLEEYETEVAISLQNENRETTVYTSSENNATGRPIETFRETSGECEVDVSSLSVLKIVYGDPPHSEPLHFYAFVLLGTVLVVSFTYSDYRSLRERDALRKQVVKTELYSKQKDVFFSKISHEIRTPTNGIMGIIDILKREGVSHEELGKWLRCMGSCGMYLLHLVNNSIEMSNIETGNVDIRDTYFEASVFRNCVSEMWTMNKNSGHKMSSVSIVYENMDPETRLFSDVDKAKQILVNLLSNAFKFTETGSVDVFVRWDPRDAETSVVTIRVVDTGKGIREEDIGTIFKSYKEIGGIGLCVSKALSEIMKGKLSVTRNVPWGSVFVVSLPAKSRYRSSVLKKYEFSSRDTTPEGTTNRKTLDESKKRALVVDDNRVNVKVLQKIITNHGLECDAAYDGLKAIDLCLENEYDIIFMDKSMEPCDGLECTREIRKRGKNRDTCIVFNTAETCGSSRRCCLESGGTDFMPKPLTSSAVLNTLTEYVF